MIHIKELQGAEGAHVSSFLRDHIHSADDLTVRWKWEPGSVAFWDNRVVVHRAVPGGYNTSLREGKRTAVFGERPFYEPTGLTWSERYGSSVVRGNDADSKKESLDDTQIDGNGYAQ